jgi:hypothetical protein
LPKTYIDVRAVESFRDEAITLPNASPKPGVSVDLHLRGGASMVSGRRSARSGVAGRQRGL